MSRARKLLIVSVVLAVGIGLALPFRKTVDDQGIVHRDEAAPAAPVSSSPPLSEVEPPVRFSQPPVQARVTSTSDFNSAESRTREVPSFDLVKHPALQSPVEPVQSRRRQRVADRQVVAPVRESRQYRPTPDQPRPAYETIQEPGYGEADWPREVVHVVQDGDTLEKLARRYMEDEGRAMEIFEMNLDQLANPHQLPIGAELRIPVAPNKILD